MDGADARNYTLEPDVADVSIPDSLTSGSLSDSPLTVLLVAAERQRATGVLRLGTLAGSAAIFLRDGAATAAAAPQGYVPLGQVLLEEGLIDVDGYARALAAAGTGRAPEAALRDRLGVDAFARGEAAATARAVAGIAAEARGDFAFEPTAEIPGWAASTPVPLVRALLDALAVPGADALIRAATGGVAAEGRGLVFDALPEPIIAALRPAERRLAHGLHAGAEFLASAPEAPRVAAAMLLSGAAREVDLAQERERGAREAEARAVRGRRAVAEEARDRRQQEAARRAGEARRRTVPADLGAVDLSAVLPPEAEVVVDPTATVRGAPGDTHRFVPEEPSVQGPNEFAPGRARTPPGPTEVGQSGAPPETSWWGEASAAPAASIAAATEGIDAWGPTDAGPAEPVRPVEVAASDLAAAADPGVGLWNIGRAADEPSPIVLEPVAAVETVVPIAAEPASPTIWGESSDALPMVEAIWVHEADNPVEPIRPDPVAAPPGPASPAPSQWRSSAAPSPIDTSWQGTPGGRPEAEPLPIEPIAADRGANAAAPASYLDQAIQLTTEVGPVPGADPLGVFAQPRPLYLTPQPGTIAPVSLPPEPAASGPGGAPQTAAESGDINEDLKYRSDEERARRQRLLRRAIENIGALRVPSVEAGEPESAPAPSAPARAGGALSINERDLAATIEAKHRTVALEDFFVRLGVARTSSKEQVKTWFFQLAKVYHPDRLPPSLHHLAPKASEVFEKLREAYETLSDDARRAEYLKRVARGAGDAAVQSVTKAEDQAREEAKQGEILLRRKDFAGAERRFARAHELQPRAEYLAARGWAIYLDPDRKGDLAEVKSLIAKALSADGSCDRALYYSGVIARVEGNMDRAESAFRAAVRANPKHVDAQQEVHLIEMRRKKDKGR